MLPPFLLTRRRLLAAAATGVLAGCTPQSIRSSAPRGRIRALPLADVRLTPSPYLDAVSANRVYLLRLEPDRLLNPFRVQAGLASRGDSYGGWERETIAGHSLGHYLSACSLMHAQTGDAECRRRVRAIVGELRACQLAGGDGFVAGFTRRTDDGRIEPGRRVFEEVARGEIHSARFYLNGCWAPFYNWHKLLAGLLEAERHCGNAEALGIAAGLAAFIERALAPLDEAQMQSVLETEFGGMSEALVELHARTGDPRWLALARRFHHHAVLDPLIEGRDQLAYLHANTQIPKLIGLARLHALEGRPEQLRGARFFWRAVTTGRSYAIGGNSDRENFQEPGSISRYVTEQTCESCNTYNMLKLTRGLYAAEPDTAYFDYYERAHLNHILAHQRPGDGMFAYMVPLMSGSAREFSEPFESFWCCVGTGMESHAKHGDSAWWQDDRTLYVNLFVPSELHWREREARIALETGYPYDERIALRIDELGGDRDFAIAFRVPGWCATPTLALNGRPRIAQPSAGYLTVERRWRAGDRVEIRLPMDLRFEPTPDDEQLVALLHGPLVLAADLGPASEPFDGPEPSLVSADPLAAIEAVAPARAEFRSVGAGRPGELRFAPFYGLYDRRTAVYFRRYTPAGWQAALAAGEQERERQRALDARSIDVIRLGDAADEGRHGLSSDISYAVSYRRRPGRDARTGGYFEFDAAVRDQPLVLRAAYWGGERDRVFHVEIDGSRIASVRLQGEHAGEFIERDYAIPRELVAGKASVRIRFQPERGFTAGPVFGCRIFRPV